MKNCFWHPPTLYISTFLMLKTSLYCRLIIKYIAPNVCNHDHASSIGHSFNTKQLTPAKCQPVICESNAGITRASAN